MKKLNKFAIVISKIGEVLSLAAAFSSFFLTAVSAFGKPEWFALLTDVYFPGRELSVYGFSLGIGNGTAFNKSTFVIFFITAMLILCCESMIFRNMYLIMKTTQGKTYFAKGETPFQPDNIRMVREIGIFFISISIIQLIMSIIARIVLGSDIEVQSNFTFILVGIIVICLSQYFDYGMKLQNEVDGLL